MRFIKDIVSMKIKRIVYNVVIIAIYLSLLVYLPIKYRFRIFGDNGSLLFLYLLFVPLIFSFIPYKLARLKGIKERYIFIIGGFFIPFVLLYIYIYI